MPNELSRGKVKESAYDLIRKRECGWCAKGFSQIEFYTGDFGHQISEDIYFPHNVPCTAPTKDAAIESLNTQLADIRDGLKSSYGQDIPITSGDPQPCPMPGCGGKAVMAFYSSRNVFWIRCDRNIFHAGPHKESEAEALAAWNEPLSLWRCFHCGFETSDKAIAAAHFGDRDDPEECTPLCRWWANMTPEERGDALQDVVVQMNQERESSEAADNTIATLRARLEAAEKRLNGLAELAAGNRTQNGLVIFPTTRHDSGELRWVLQDLGDEDGSTLGDELSEDQASFYEAIDAAIHKGEA